MHRRAVPVVSVMVAMMLAAAPQQAQTPAGQTPPPQGTRIPESQQVQLPTNLFQVPEGFEVTVWATTPMLRNPTNIDIDKDGRIWVAEGVRYRSHHARQPEGDRIIVLQDTNGDGKADSTHTFVQEPALIAPLGVSVIDNKIIVAQPPDLIVYTDVNRNLKFDPGTDIREVLLTGFQGVNHDHALHSVTVGPDGKWIWNSGNMGATFTDRSGKTFRIFSSYRPPAPPTQPFRYPHDPAVYAGKPSDDGHVYLGGFTARMNPDGTNVEIIGHNYRNSYEQSVTSLGDVFQNDNDDPPASRVAWVPEYANFGFSSNDGQRTWQADRRPGQSIPTAEWRQDDPGMTPAGDVYGGGSPTGNVFYENGALGAGWDGTFFAAEPGRNEIFSYQPVRKGAGFSLERKIFITTNVKRQYAGSDFVGGNATAMAAPETLFRPSDVAVGPDGALYVSDWIDPRVGGHQDLDDSLSGAIYRIAPKGFVPRAPTFDVNTIDGLVTALRSPAVNVRAIGFEGLKAKGAEAVNAVAALLNDPSPYMKGRAIFLLNQLGPEGRARVGSPESQSDPALRIAAFRAMRRAGLDVAAVSARLAKDTDAGVRREVALSLRDKPAAESLDLLIEIARGYDGQDRQYLEAWGTGATNKEVALYPRIRTALGVKDALTWSPAFARLAWRLHVPAAVADLTTRARAEKLSTDDRRLALDTLAFIDSPAASKAMLALAAPSSPFREVATFWLLNRMSNNWASHGLGPALKSAGIYDPATIVLKEFVTAPPAAGAVEPSVAEVLRLTGNAPRGKAIASRCLMCHTIAGTGAELGPALDGWGQGKSADVIATAVVDPNADIASGYGATEIRTKDGLTIQGLVIKQNDPVMMRSIGGITQIIPNDRIATRLAMPRTLMMTPSQLGMTAQDIADVVAFLRE